MKLGQKSPVQYAHLVFCCKKRPSDQPIRILYVTKTAKIGDVSIHNLTTFPKFPQPKLFISSLHAHEFFTLCSQFEIKVTD